MADALEGDAERVQVARMNAGGGVVGSECVLERRICIARGSNVEVLAKFADRKSASSYTGNLNDVIGALKVDELTDLHNNHCGDLDVPPREKKFAKKADAKKALTNVLANAKIAEPKNGGRKRDSRKKQPKGDRNRVANGKSKMDKATTIVEKNWEAGALRHEAAL
jgi:hypothetical protein